MKENKYFSNIVSSKSIIYIALFISTFSLLLAGIHLFCQKQQALPCTQNSEEAFTSEQFSGMQDTESAAQIQANIAKNIIRLHVIANSDSNADQQLKYIVRDKIISSLREAMQDADSIAEAQKIILAHQFQIEENANQVLAEQGSPYTATVSLRSRYFPVKQYGDLSFPAGFYHALCVEIGKAEGRNWWCVLFPSLCFVNETTATVPDESKDKLKEHLTEEEYQYISEDSEDTDTPVEETRPEFRFGILDWLMGR